MDRIWAPWRIQYILEERPAPGSCVFCEKNAASDNKNALVLLKGVSAFAMMNLYPYNAGHVLVAPYRHTSCITELDSDELLEIMEIARSIVSATRTALTHHGFNMGFNIGQAGGAGIADHIHFHIVPRWNGDGNFMPALGNTRIISEHIESTYEKIIEALGGSEACRTTQGG